MRMNHAPGAESSRTARAHGRRKSAAETRARAALTAASAAVIRVWRPRRWVSPQPCSAGDFGPLLLPLAVVHAVVAPVATLRHGRLPEPDAVEVGRGGVGVVDRARSLADLFHEAARLRVGGRLAV